MIRAVESLSCESTKKQIGPTDVKKIPMSNLMHWFFFGGVGGFWRNCLDFMEFLLSANEVAVGNVFTPVCDSVHGGRHPLSRHPLGRQTPHGQTPLGRHPSPGKHPPTSWQTPPRQTPPPRPPTASAADGTHPTGMHSCSDFFVCKIVGCPRPT